MSLFRQAALNAQHNLGFGRIVLIRPVSFTFLAVLAATCACAVLVFLVLGQYTKHARVVGMLVPDAGLIKVTTPVAGLVLEQHVEAVKKTSLTGNFRQPLRGLKRYVYILNVPRKPWPATNPKTATA